MNKDAIAHFRAVCLLTPPLGGGVKTPAEQAKDHRMIAAAAIVAAERCEKEAAEQERKEALLNKIEEQRQLAQATGVLLGEIRNAVCGGRGAVFTALAKFRDELQPVAKSYGYKIVLVGDKTQAMLTVI